MAFQKLVRFEHNGDTSYGNLVAEEGNTFQVQRLDGSIKDGFKLKSSEMVEVSKLLCPVETTPIIICVGLNYSQHAKEANLPVPKYPVIFTKPADALAGPGDSISIPHVAQSHLDYEGELTFVVSKDVKDLPVHFELADYILGYTAGNDLSARNFQLPEASGGQFCYCKSFDSFAPIGHYLASPSIVPDPQALRYRTLVNGQVEQETGTDDMIWSVKDILRHISTGTTVRAGTVVMTGTPSGVGYFKNKFLKNGDVVQIEIDGLAKVSNKVNFDLPN